MSIQFKVLGKPGRDNALFVWLNTGTKLYRILFDCGENVLYTLKQHDIKSIDYLFLSHLHIDHIAGFDYYFRRNFDREKPNFIWGPGDTSEILHNKLKGFKWNLNGESPGEFIITDITEKNTSIQRFVTSESFMVKHSGSVQAFDSVLIDNPDFTIKAAILNHSIPSIVYSLVEKDSLNINKDALQKSGLTPGKWLELVRDLSLDDNTIIDIENNKLRLRELRETLLKVSKGRSISYLTDFIYDEAARARVVRLAQNSDIAVCESQYHSDDIELAGKNYHLTAKQAAMLAKEANVKQLILFHISERYTTTGNYAKLLDDARTIFPETYFPEGWGGS